jgi:hypothetical protein
MTNRKRTDSGLSDGVLADAALHKRDNASEIT